MVFARSVTHPDTRYALAAAELRTPAAQGVRADALIQTRAVSA